MPKSTKPPYLRFKRGVYYYQRRVPEDVRHSLPFSAMASMYEVSLRTSVMNEALRLLADKNDWFDTCLAAVRAGTDPPAGSTSATVPTQLAPLDDAWAAMHGRQHYEALVEITRELQRAQIRREAGAEERLEHWYDFDLADVNSRIDALDAGAFEVMRRVALRVFLSENRIKQLPPPSTIRDHFRRHPIEATEAFKKLCEQLGRAEMEARAHLNMPAGSPAPYEIKTPSLRDAAKSIEDISKYDLRTIVKQTIAVAADKGEDWRFRLQRAVDIWIDLDLPPNIRDAKKSHVIDYVEQLMKCPVNIRQRCPGLTWAQAIAANEPRKWNVISPVSIRDAYLAPLKQVFTYAAERELVEKSVAARVAVPGVRPKRQKHSRRGTPFNGVELNALFALPIFTGCESTKAPLKSGSVLLDDHQFWGPLVALFTGARTTELAQILLNEVLLDEITPHFIIQSDRERRVKTHAAHRTVPIHPTLLEIGFAAYVKELRRRGEKRLFPQWTAPVGKGYADAPSQRRFKRSIVPMISARTKPRPNFHSFRHTMKDAMANSAVPPQQQNAMLGHDQEGQDANYLHGLTVEALAESMAKIRFQGLRLEHLYGTRPSATRAPKSKSATL